MAWKRWFFLLDGFPLPRRSRHVDAAVGALDSQLGSTSGCIGLIAEVHGCDKTAVHGEYVENLAVRKNIPFKTLDELVHPDAGLASVFLGHCNSPHCRVQ